jgi:hypothetical protein
MMSSTSTAIGVPFDSSKLNQLLEKINSAGNLEIEERSIKNLAQKL